MSRINQLSPCRQSVSIGLDFTQLAESRFITLVYRHLEDKLKRHAEYWQLKSNPESSSAFKCKALSAIDEFFGLQNMVGQWGHRCSSQSSAHRRDKCPNRHVYLVGRTEPSVAIALSSSPSLTLFDTSRATHSSLFTIFLAEWHRRNRL